MSAEDFNAQIGRLDERMKGMEQEIAASERRLAVRIEDLAVKVDAMRAPKMWPIITGIASVLVIVATAGTAWVNMRIKPLELELARNAKDFDRLYDDFKALQSAVANKADKSYVDDKISYTFHELKNRINAAKLP